MTHQQTVAVEYLRKFPSGATQTLARAAYKAHPELWPTLQSARTTIRRMRGASGKRSCKSNQEHYRPPQAPGDPFGKLPDPREMLAKWHPLAIAGPTRVLCLADVHIPYHDARALRAALVHGTEYDADLILLNGDIADFFSVSRWETDPRERDFPAEVSDVRQFLTAIREAFPRARIVYKLGNHEERWLRYMRLKAPELLGIADFEFGAVLGLAKLRIELVDSCRPIKVGKLNFLHGHEYRFAISNPVNPARGLFLRGKVNAVCGHFHQSSHHSEKNLEQWVISCWSTGCLCDLHPEYRPINNWGHGFAFVEVDKAGAFAVDNLRIVDGQIWH